MTNKKIAFLGLGVMGSAMAANLARGGCNVTAWNRTIARPSVAIAQAAGAQIVSSISEAVSEAEIICTCLGDIADVEEVLLGQVCELGRSPALIIDASTIGSDAARHIGKSLAEKGFRFLDAPVSGGDIGAKNGTLTFMVGGSEIDFAEAQPYLAMMGKNIFHCGAIGSGQAVKLCNQVLVSAYMVGISEAMLLAEKTGIDPSLVVEVCGSGAAASWALSNLGSKVATSDFQPGFMIKHMLKDLRIVQEVGDAENLLGTKLGDRLFKIVSNLENGSEQGTQAMIRAYREQ